MPNYRRAFSPGGTFFFTLVTYRRARFLCDERARALLHEAIEQCRDEHPFTIDALVLLPDHLHAIWTLPDGDADSSSRWGRIKRAFTQAWTSDHGWEGAVSESRDRERRRGVWQRRFWEHVIRDETDYQRHLDYVHYNPVKHGLAKCPHTWAWSTFHRHVREGHYVADWWCACTGGSSHPPDSAGLDLDAAEPMFGE
jgi:putative transposase